MAEYQRKRKESNVEFIELLATYVMATDPSLSPQDVCSVILNFLEEEAT